MISHRQYNFMLRMARLQLRVVRQRERRMVRQARMAHERNELMQQQISAMQLCLQRELAEQHSLEAERAVLCQNIALQGTQ